MMLCVGMLDGAKGICWTMEDVRHAIPCLEYGGHSGVADFG
jgi:hypothetical protein